MKLLFLHLEKTGGTSIVNGLRQAGLSVTVTEDPQLSMSADVIAGHFSAREILAFDGRATFTVLRDPTERATSYLQSLYRRQGHLQFEHNGMLELLKARPSLAAAQLKPYYLNKLSDHTRTVASCVRTILAFDHVGFTHKLEDTWLWLEKTLGRPLPRLPRDNKSDLQIELTKAYLCALYPAQAEDYAIYDFAKRRLE